MLTWENVWNCIWPKSANFERTFLAMGVRIHPLSQVIILVKMLKFVKIIGIWIVVCCCTLDKTRQCDEHLFDKLAHSQQNTGNSQMQDSYKSWIQIWATSSSLYCLILVLFYALFVQWSVSLPKDVFLRRELVKLALPKEILLSFSIGTFLTNYDITNWKL